MSKSKVLCIWFVLSIIIVPLIHAQLENRIDLLLTEEQAGFGKAVYLVLVASELFDESESIAGALETLKGKNWDIPAKAETDTITLGEYAYLLMKAFKIQGGIMYMLMPGPRYAVKELAYHKLILKYPYPGRKVSGEEVMTILTRLIDWKEGL